MPFSQESSDYHYYCMFHVFKLCNEAANEIDTDGNKALESLPGVDNN